LSKEKAAFFDRNDGKFEIIPSEARDFIKGEMASYYEGKPEAARAAFEAL